MRELLRDLTRGLGCGSHATNRATIDGGRSGDMPLGKGFDILGRILSFVFRSTFFLGLKSEPELTGKSDEFARRVTLPRELGNVVGAPSWSDCSAERSKARASVEKVESLLKV